MTFRVAFYAPMKPVDHPTPSGDRQVARLLVAALESGGHAVEVVSRLRSYSAHPEPTRFAAAEAEARGEIARIAARWSVSGDRPDLWFTYHPYYKAPDLIGPALARQFGLPYVTAEASHAGRRADGPWAAWHARAEAAIRMACLNVCFTARDRAGLAAIVDDEARLTLLPPFIAGTGSPSRPSGPLNEAERAVRLVTVAMMRPGDKTRSYQALAQALAALPPEPAWHLTIAGDGPARDAVRRAFADLPPARITWRGELAAAAVAEVLAEADLYVWPGFGEAFGLAYLEAAAAGLPSVAMDCGGVSSVVGHGRTGLLAPEGDAAGFVAALHRLMTDRAYRAALGREARRVALEERTVERAGAALRDALSRACAPRLGSVA